MLVSVIIPAFDRENTIQRAIESVFAQTYAPIELIVVDDGSRDRTADVVAGYGSRLTLIRQQNGGPSAARNAGIRAASGSVLAFLDSDDTWHPQKLARQIALMQSTALRRVPCCVCNATMVYPDGRRRTSFEAASLRPALPEGIWKNPTEVLITRFLLFNQVVAVWRDALEEVGLFSSDLRLMEDHDLALRLSTAGPWAFIAAPLVTWHGGEKNSLSNAAKRYEISRCAHEILSRFRQSAPLGPHLRRLAERELQLLRWRIAALERSSSSKSGDRIGARVVLAFLRLYESYRHRQDLAPMITRRVRNSIATSSGATVGP